MAKHLLNEELPFRLKHTSFVMDGVSNASLVWKNKESSNDTSGSSGSDLVKQFGYVRRDNFFFENLKFDNKQLHGHSDYYGGMGVASNLGSGRSAMFNGALVKGIGHTPLASEKTELYCRSGIYPLYEGITEILSYEIWRDTLPGGIISHKCLLHIGQSNGHVHSNSPNQIRPENLNLGLLVRDMPLRIGHFIRNLNSRADEDIERVSNNIRFLCTNIVKEPETFFSSYIDKIAK